MDCGGNDAYVRILDGLVDNMGASLFWSRVFHHEYTRLTETSIF